MLRYARWTVLGLFGIASAAGPEVSLIAADETPAPSPAASTVGQSDTQAIEDVTDQVRVRLTGTLTSNKSGVLFTGVTVENMTGERLEGRLVVVVADTKVEGLTLGANDGALAGGESFVEVLPQSGSLKPGAKTPSQRIEFLSTERVTAASRKAFAPELKVLRVEAVPRPITDLAALDRDALLPGKNYSQARLEAVMAIQERHSPQLVKHPGVFATAVSEDANGNLVMRVYTQRHGIIKELPGEFEGIALDQSVTGISFSNKPAWTRPSQPSRIAGGAKGLLPAATEEIEDPVNPKQKFPRPIPIGVSIGNVGESPVCASGTLGCRIVFADGRLGILTNSHVGSRNGVGPVIMNPLEGIAGDGWTQPGCADSGDALLGDVIANLVDYQIYDATAITNIMDASVGLIQNPNRNLVLASTPPGGYGYPSRTPVTPTIGMRVQKYGRTTGLRKGTVEGVNSYVEVSYEDAIVPFTGQIVISAKNSMPFSSSGDSGSLIVTQYGNHPIGLLYAGAGPRTIANPIQPILARFNIAIDDGSETPPNAAQPRGNGRMGTATSGYGGIIPE